MVSRVALAAASYMLLVAPSEQFSSHPPLSHAPSPVELSESGSELDGDDNVAGSTCKLDSTKNSSMLGPEEEEEKEEKEKDMDNFIDLGRFKLHTKDEIHRWKELQDQIKSDMNEGYKQHETLTHMNKLLILRNFVTLHIKGVKRIAASQEIVWQFYEGAGVHFAH